MQQYIPSSSVQYEVVESIDHNAPPFDRATGIKKVCLASLVFSTLVGIVAIIVGCVSKGGDKTFHFSPAGKEMTLLALNILLLGITESLGYIHATSLRWALFYENRLDFNSNLRLLKFARKSPPNGKFFSILFFICTAFCYATGNMVLVFNTASFYSTRVQYDTSVDFDSVKDLISLPQVTPILLGVAILIQCAICFWCIRRTKIPSWSSDPLNTAAFAIGGGLLLQRNGRAMMSVHDRKKDDMPMKPTLRQLSARSASRAVIWILWLVILVLTALVIWSIVIVFVGYRNKNGSSWGFFPTATGDFSIINGLTGTDLKNDEHQTLTVFLFFFASAGMGAIEQIPEWRMIFVLLFYLVIQSVVTIGLHCAELQCNLARDETVWRSISSRDGSITNSIYNSVTQPFKAWQSLGLLVAKPVIHWLFGSAIQVDYGQGMLMRVPHITYLAAAWLVFVIFVVAVSLVRPKGYLPATYGHLQTMVNVADLWSEKMFWGDKGVFEGDAGIRHSGTSQDRLPDVLVDALYA